MSCETVLKALPKSKGVKGVFTRAIKTTQEEKFVIPLLSSSSLLFFFSSLLG